jgi:hypothetical protein
MNFLGSLNNFGLKGIHTIFVACILLVHNSVAEEGRKVALVIGNQHYNNDAGSLTSPNKDADDMAKALTEIGFEVTEKKDRGLDEMLAEIEDFAQVSKTADVALFYFSGHGIMVEGENYLIPIDVQNTALYADPKNHAVSMEGSVFAGKMSQAHVKIYIFDACRDKWKLRPKSYPQGFSSLGTGAGGTVIVYAAAPGQLAFDDPNKSHSVFTDALLKHLREDQDLLTILLETQADVAEGTSLAQMPWISLSPGLYKYNLPHAVHRDSATDLALSGKGPQPPKPVVNPALLKEPTVRAFLETHLEALQSEQLDTYISAYDANVAWYLEGFVSTDYIRNYTSSLYRHFDELKRVITGDIKITELPDSRGILVRYPVHYDYSKTSGKRITGDVTDIIGIRAIGDKLKIFSQDYEF